MAGPRRMFVSRAWAPILRGELTLALQDDGAIASGSQDGSAPMLASNLRLLANLARAPSFPGPGALT